MLVCTGTRTVRGHRMGSGVKLLCSGCLRANTDGLPICHTANTPPSLGQSPSLCVTALASCIPGSQRGAENTVSHLSAPNSGYLWKKKLPVLVKSFVIRPLPSTQITQSYHCITNISRHGWELIMWGTDRSNADSQEDTEAAWWKGKAKKNGIRTKIVPPFITLSPNISSFQQTSPIHPAEARKSTGCYQ